MARTLGPIDAAAAAESASSLAEIVAQLEAAGYVGQMAARPGGCVLCFTCHTESDASTFQVEVLRRTEGASDPDDMLAVAALTCPACGAKGTAALKYGPEASLEEAEVLRDLEDHRTDTGVSP